MDKARQLNKLIARIFGFTKSGKSLLGKKIAKVSAVKNIRKILTGVIICLVIAFAVFPNISLAANIGGIPVINTTPSPHIIETTTRMTVRVPVETIYISQKFGWFHSGIDLVADTGTPVYPMMDGVVSYTEEGWLGYGHHVIIDHGGGLSTLYGHLSKIEVKTGDKVDIKTELGKSGSTGFSTGPHLHLELHQDGHAINPAELLPEIINK